MRKLRFIRWWLSIGWILVGIVVFLSLTPSPPDLALGVPEGDKLGHLLAYMVVMFWFGCIYLPGRSYESIGIGFIFMGFILELLQGLTGHRTMEWADMVANTMGVAIGRLLAWTRVSGMLTALERRLLAL